MKIPINEVDTEEYLVGDKYNDYINGKEITKIKLVHTSIIHRKIKSANKI